MTALSCIIIVFDYTAMASKSASPAPATTETNTMVITSIRTEQPTIPTMRALLVSHQYYSNY